MIDNEEWRAIVGYGGLYEVSSMGRVRSLGAHGKYGKSNEAKILTASVGRIYLKLNLSVCGIVNTYTIHRLVCETFIGPRPEENHINHKNGNKLDNRAENLEYCTPSQNTQHAYDNGFHSQLGSKNARSKLSENDVLQICGLFKEGLKDRQIGVMFGVGRVAINDIRRGARWSHLTGIAL